MKTKTKKIYVGISLAVLFALFFAGTYFSVTTSNTGVVVVTGKVTLDRVSIMNLSDDTSYTMFYNKSTAATYTDTPVFPPVQCFPHSQILFGGSYDPNPDFVAGLSMRTVMRGTTTNTVNASAYSILSSTVSVSPQPIISLKYHQ